MAAGDGRERPIRGGGDFDPQPGLAHELGDELRVARVVFDDQDARAYRSLDHHVLERDPEARADSFDAREVDESVLQLDKLLGDRKTEPRAGDVALSLMEPL